MGELANYGRLAETVFIIPTDEEVFLTWLRARAARDAGIGYVPSLKHYHYSHLDSETSIGVGGSKELGIRRDVFHQSWHRIPLVCINIITLSPRRDAAQCEIWVARLQQRGTLNGEPAEVLSWQIANYEYDRLISDINSRWPKTIVSSYDYRAQEWEAWQGRLPGSPPNRSIVRAALVSNMDEDKQAHIVAREEQLRSKKELLIIIEGQLAIFPPGNEPPEKVLQKRGLQREIRDIENELDDFQK